MRDAIVAGLDRADADDSVRAVIVTGAGRAFCAGADMSAGGSRFDVDARAASGTGIRDNGGIVSLRVFSCLKPVIAAVNGAAVGVGATMLPPRDVRLASTAARFGFPFARHGLVPEACSGGRPATYSREERRLISPVLALQMTSHATERRFYGHILQAMGVPFAPRATVLKLELQALRNLKRMEVKLLMLDEVHNLLAGSAKEQRILLNTLRYISNELQISLVCLGIGDAREAIGGDVQLMRHFEEVTLPRWQGNAEFEQLLDAILRHLPLKLASQVSARALRQVLQATDGITARVFGLFNDLAIASIRSGAERIDNAGRGLATDWSGNARLGLIVEPCRRPSHLFPPPVQAPTRCRRIPH